MNAPNSASLRTFNPRSATVVRSLLLFTFTLSAAPRPAWAQTASEVAPWGLPGSDDADTQQAIKNLMRTGITEYRKHNFEPARQAFDEAWRLRHHLAIAASLAEVEMKLGRYRDAAEHWRYYIEQLDAEHASDRADAEAQVRECRKHLGSVRVTMEPPDAQLTIDDEAVGRGPFEKDFLLAPGQHTLRAELGGRTSPSKQIIVAAEQDQATALALPAEPRTSAAAATQLTPQAPSPGKPQDSGRSTPRGRTVAVVTGGVLATAAIGVGIWYTVAAASTRRDLDAVRQQVDNAGDPELVKQGGACTPPPGVRPAQCDQLVTKANEFDRERNIGVAGYVTGGVLAAGTVATYFLWPHGRTERPRSGSWTVSPWSVAGARGLRLDLTF